jgi:hypothetical protein
MTETTDASAAFERWQAKWTPEAVEARATETAAKRLAERERRRAEAAPVELTLFALTEKLGFTRAYAEHLVQPYCRCEQGHDGWQYCAHANDLGWPDLTWPPSR